MRKCGFRSFGDAAHRALQGLWVRKKTLRAARQGRSEDEFGRTLLNEVEARGVIRLQRGSTRIFSVVPSGTFPTSDSPDAVQVADLALVRRMGAGDGGGTGGRVSVSGCAHLVTSEAGDARCLK
jgi:hypothetical protein